jgi:hypothetical protein
MEDANRSSVLSMLANACLKPPVLITCYTRHATRMYCPGTLTATALQYAQIDITRCALQGAALHWRTQPQPPAARFNMLHAHWLQQQYTDRSVGLLPLSMLNENMLRMVSHKPHAALQGAPLHWCMQPQPPAPRSAAA